MSEIGVDNWWNGGVLEHKSVVQNQETRFCGRFGGVTISSFEVFCTDNSAEGLTDGEWSSLAC